MHCNTIFATLVSTGLFSALVNLVQAAFTDARKEIISTECQRARVNFQYNICGVALVIVLWLIVWIDW